MSQANAEHAPYQPYQQQPFRIRAAHLKDLPQIVTVLLTSFYAQAQSTQWLYWILRIGIQEDIKPRIKTPASQYACLVATTVGTDSGQSGPSHRNEPICLTWQSPLPIAVRAQLNSSY